MSEGLNLFVDEYPADLNQSNLFGMAVVDVPDGLHTLPASFDPLRFIQTNSIRGYVGYIDLLKEPKIADYQKKWLFAKEDEIRGVNMLWSTVAIYCTFGFIVSFYKQTCPPPINIFHDPKSLSDEHRSATYDFLKQNLPQVFGLFTEGRVRPKLLLVEQGTKNSIGIQVADFLAREHIRFGMNRFKSLPPIHIQDISRYLAENPKQYRF